MGIKFYARPGGSHIHSSKDCTMLEGGQFDHYKYKEITVEEAKALGLHVCPCVNKTFNSHHRLKVHDIKRLLNWYQFNCPDCMIDANKEDIILAERVRILDMMSRRDVGGINPEWALSDAQYQNLKA